MNTTQASNISAAVANVNRTFGDNRYTTRTDGANVIISSQHGDYSPRTPQAAWETLMSITCAATQGRG